MVDIDPDILIVDDEALIADFVELVLEAEGLPVLAAVGTVKEALAAAAVRPPGIAVLDVNLADGEDGVALALRLQSDHGTRIVFISGAENPLKRAAEAGVAGARFLQKPFVGSDLAAMLRSSLTGGSDLQPDD